MRFLRSPSSSRTSRGKMTETASARFCGNITFGLLRWTRTVCLSGVSIPSISWNVNACTPSLAYCSKQYLMSAATSSRRGRGRGRRRPRHLLRHAAGQGRNRLPLRRLRRARGGGRAARRACRFVERREQLASIIDRRRGGVQLSEVFDDGEALFAAARAAALRGDRRQAAGLRPTAGQALSRLAEDQNPRSPGVRDRRLHEGPGKPGGPVRRARPRRLRGGRLATPATSAPASTTPRSSGCSRPLRPLERRGPPFAEAPKLPKVRQGRHRLGRAELVCEVEFAEWTHDGRLRAPSYQGCARTSSPTRCGASASRLARR